MKKLLVVLLAFPLLTLSGCSKKNDTNSKLIISEVVEGTGDNRAVELYNRSQGTINLNDYSLEIQLKNSSKIVALNGNLKPNETFVVAYSDASEEILNKSNLVSDNLTFIGSQPILLKKGSKIVDILGIKDTNINYGADISLVRKKEFLIGRKEFVEYDWIRYNCDNINYLGTIEPSISNEELLLGPKLTDLDYSRPFYIEQENGSFLGGGGVMEVTVSSYVDGDTTCFNYDPTIISKIGVEQGTKLRYQNIDTPECYYGNIQEFGLVAKDYTNFRLSNALHIQVQSVLNGSLTETFDRMLGWVWVDDELLNFHIVLMGYSNSAFAANDEMRYKDVSYSNFIHNAQLYAQLKNRGIHGEKDPYWDYDAGHVKDEYNK